MRYVNNILIFKTKTVNRRKEIITCQRQSNLNEVNSTLRSLSIGKKSEDSYLSVRHDTTKICLKEFIVCILKLLLVDPHEVEVLGSIRVHVKYHNLTLLLLNLQFKQLSGTIWLDTSNNSLCDMYVVSQGEKVLFRHGNFTDANKTMVANKP